MGNRRDDLSDLLLWRRRRGAPSWLLRDPDTGGLPALDIDYAGGRAFKGSVVDLAGLHTVSRASGGYAENLDGSLTWFGNNALRRTDRGVLVEGARTNLLLRSQEFGHAAWPKTHSSIVDDAAIAPDGTVLADKFIAANGQPLASATCVQDITKSASATTYTFSVFGKAAELNRIQLFTHEATNTANNARVFVSLTDGTITSAASSAGTFTNASAVVQSLYGGWYRCALTFTTGTETALRCRVYASDSVASVGNGASGIYIWGAQLEAAAFASSYIPTGASTAARASDRVTLDPSFIGGEGTFIAETFGSAGNSSNGRIIGLGDPGSVAALNRTNAANTVQAWNGTQSVTATMGAGSWEGVVRAAIAFSPAGRAICGNAGGVATDAYALGNKTSLAVGSQPSGGNPFCGYIRRVTYFDRRISNAGLQALTA